jgi:ubiquinone/menaquinone biosynthesis C-methylase UbiE
VYEERQRTVPWQRYSVASPGALFMYQQRVRDVVRLLSRSGCFPLTETRILDIGCGGGGWLVDFESWGATQSNLAGIDLDPPRVEQARMRLRAADIREGDASALPWEDGSFDLIVQGTVFTSILDAAMRHAVAREMTRLLAPGGAVLWYDFRYDSPRNPDVRGVRAGEIRELFPELGGRLHRVTLAPPLSRRLAPRAWSVARLLESLRVLNTHYLALLRRQ